MPSSRSFLMSKSAPHPSGRESSKTPNSPPKSIFFAKKTSGFSGRENGEIEKSEHSLKESKKKWGKGKEANRIAEALSYNQKIWTFFQNELMNPRNPLPYELKENIIRLGIYVSARISYINEVPSPDKLDSIIEINLNLAAGLTANPHICEGHVQL